MTDQLNITKEQFLQWLAEHPEVAQEEAFLSLLQLTDNRRGVASLLNYQNELLRAENSELVYQLNELVLVAQENDHLFNKTRELILDLIRATSVEQLTSAVQEHFKQEFCACAVELQLYALEESLPQGSFRFDEPATMNADIQAMLAKKSITCGTFHTQEFTILFGEESIGSAALIQLNAEQQPLGILAIGSEDPLHFHKALDTLFIEHVGAALSLRLAQLMPATTELPHPAKQVAQ